jgi:hypothetical protein
LVFTRVLDQMLLGLEEDDTEEEPRDRAYWETRSSSGALALVDHLFKLASEVDPSISLSYRKQYIGLSRSGIASNFVTFRPRRHDRVIVGFRNPRTDALSRRVDESGIEELAKGRWNSYRLRIAETDVNEHADLLRELMKLSCEAHSARA